MTSMDQFLLPSPPFDSVSKVRYSPKNLNHLLVSAWDATVRFYEVGSEGTANSEQKSKYEHRAAVLDCCFAPDGKFGFSGGLDHTVRYIDFDSEKMQSLGTHSDAVSTMTYAAATNSLVTGSWDRTLRVWDPRAPTAQQASHQTPERIYHLDMSTGTNMVVAMASRLFHIYDVRRMDIPAQVRDSSLKYMTRAVACMTDGQGYAVSSVEGRIAVEYFDVSPTVQSLKYAFKCHRATERTDTGEIDHVWPVNALAFHPQYNTFASAGSDGNVSTWDHKAKKRLRQFPKYKDPVSSIAFNNEGSHLAIATSYTWDTGKDGCKDGVTPAIYIRKLGDEVKPRDMGPSNT